MREYAKTWSWSPGKVIRFIAEILKIDSDESLSIPIKNSGTEAEQQRNSSGTAKQRKNSKLQSTIEQEQNRDGTEAERLYIREKKREEYLSLFDLWNEVVTGILPTVRKPLSSDRQKKCAVRMKEHSLQEWREIFRLMITTPFLCGSNDRGWQADFDWIIANDGNATKVLEGKYQNAGGRVVSSNDTRYAAIFAGA